jgi:hypothetical protein
MSPEALVWWATLAGAVVILVLIVGQLLRALAEVKRIARRVDGMADLPVVHALDRAEANGRRIEGALAQIAPLQSRAQAALAVIRRGPIPPELPAAIARLRAEVAAFRTFVRR